MNSSLTIKIYPFQDVSQIANKCVGSNQEQILFVLNEDDYFPLVEKIIQALNLDITSDVSICKVTENTRFILSELSTVLSLRTIVIFGISPAQLGIQFEVAPYEPLQIADQTILLAHSLSFLEEASNKKYKQALWNFLKQLKFSK